MKREDALKAMEALDVLRYIRDSCEGMYGCEGCPLNQVACHVRPSEWDTKRVLLTVLKVKKDQDEMEMKELEDMVGSS